MILSFTCVVLGNLCIDTRFFSKGPYVYELFSIMVHSGSAAGGHYYAYIKWVLITWDKSKRNVESVLFMGANVMDYFKNWLVRM